MKPRTHIYQHGYHPDSKTWFFADAAFTDDETIPVRRIGSQADFRIHGRIYRLTYDFHNHPHHGAPFMFNNDPASGIHFILMDPAWEKEFVSGIFRSLCNHFYLAFSDFSGLLVLGAAMAYAVAPETLSRYHGHPGIWIHGPKGTGKTSIAKSIMRLWGYRLDYSPFFLSAGTTATALDRSLQTSFNIPFHLDEYREDEMTPNHFSTLRAAFGRERTAKGGLNFQVRSTAPTTSPLITGEGATNDHATLSRYIVATPQCGSGSTVEQQARFFDFTELLPELHRIVRYILMNRRRISSLFMEKLEGFAADPDTISRIDAERLKITYGSAYAMASVMIHEFNIHQHTGYNDDDFRAFTTGYAANILS